MDRRHGLIGISGLLALFLLAACYVGCFGPACWCVQKSWLSEEGVYRVYPAGIWTSLNSKNFDEVTAAYTRICGAYPTYERMDSKVKWELSPYKGIAASSICCP